jgi:hypothetical protein
MMSLPEARKNYGEWMGGCNIKECGTLKKEEKGREGAR